MTLTAGIASRLREIVPAERVIDDPTTLVPYAYDASFWSLRSRRMPDAVVLPETTAEVSAIVRLAAEKCWGIYEIAPERASLEQLFVELTGGEPAAAEAAT